LGEVRLAERPNICQRHHAASAAEVNALPELLAHHCDSVVGIANDRVIQDVEYAVLNHGARMVFTPVLIAWT
jgi:hypothetical protein